MSDRRTFWTPPATQLVAFALASVAIGLTVGETAGWAFACASLLGIVVLQLVYLYRLQRWLEAPEDVPIPEGWGAWNGVFSTLYRARRREEASRSGLATALARFQQAAGALPDGVVLLDPELHIEWCNAVAEAHFGIDLARDRGLLFTHIARHPALADYLALDVGAAPVTIRTVHQPRQILSLQLIPYGEADRLLLSRDVTAIERAERMRRDFVANVSHELRTPLTVLTGFLELADEDLQLDPATMKRQQQLMREQAAQMTRLVEDLLTLSRLEADDPVAPNTLVDVPALLRSVQGEAETLSAGRHRIRWEIDRTLALSGSERELRSVFTNLLSNAIRYTPPIGDIAVVWQTRNGEAEFTVRDSGIGIAPEHVPRLTERFYRIDTGRSRESGGTGLGLAIVKHVLARHQGRLEVDSEPGRGSLFRVVFPSRRIRHLEPEARSRDTAMPHD